MFHQFARRFSWAFALAVASSNVGSSAEPSAHNGTSRQTANPQSKITISKETTYITQPLRPDGYPNYVAALNQRMSEGVTPANNAAVPLLQAFGPTSIPKDKRQEFFKLLGIEPLPETGDYLVPQHEIIKRWKAGKLPIDAEMIPDNEYEAFGPTKERPWSSVEFPAADQWLRANGRTLQHIVAATKRPKHFIPQLGVDGKLPPLMDSLAVLVPSQREANDYLIARAMYHLKVGAAGAAWEDILTAHRLARIVAQEHFDVSAVIAAGFERTTNAADAVFLHHAKLTKEQFQTLRQERYGLPVLPKILERDCYSERIFTLDAICFVARNGDEKVGDIWTAFMNREDPLPPALLAAAKSAPIDWNFPLRACNEWFDRWSRIQRISDSAAQKAEIEELEAENSKLREAVVNPDQASQDRFAANPREEASRRVANGLVAYMVSCLDTTRRIDSMATMSDEMLKCAFALTEFRLDHAEYPKQLNELVPKYLAKLPIDCFSSKSDTVRYRREGEAYVLWSIGPNRVDDRGEPISFTDFKSTADDEVFRPAPKAGK